MAGRVRLGTAPAAEIAKLLAAADIDLAVITLPVPTRGLVVEPFFREPLVAIARPSHRGAGASPSRPATWPGAR